MNTIRRYDIQSNMWLVGYYIGTKFVIVSKQPA